jgi:hypothetical protein
VFVAVETATLDDAQVQAIQRQPGATAARRFAALETIRLLSRLDAERPFPEPTDEEKKEEEKKKEEDNQKKIAALAAFLKCEVDDVTATKYETFEAEGAEYKVLDDVEADEAAKENITESLWAFNAEFIISQCGLEWSQAAEDSLKQLQGDACESCNAFFQSLISKCCGLDKFIDAAIAADGRGHFLNTYDGEEKEEGEFFIYRVN